MRMTRKGTEMERIKKYIECYVETETCNLKCHYCYIAQQNKFNNQLITFTHSPAEIREALSVSRLGGVCLLNFCAGGETLLAENVLPVIKELAEEGHFISIVTNGTMKQRFQEIAAWPKDIQEHLFFKFSFHYLELKRLNLMEIFFDNIKMISNSLCSFTVELVGADEFIPYINDIKRVCMENLGTLCHVTIPRDDRTNGIELLSKYSLDEFYSIWSTFQSALLDYKYSIFKKKQTKFCYAGAWSYSLDLNSGDYRQCYWSNVLGNIYSSSKETLRECPVGENCEMAHCYNGHAFLTLGNIPELNTIAYAETRNRLEGTASEWLKPRMKEVLSCKLYDSNERSDITEQDCLSKASTYRHPDEKKVSVVIPVYNAEKYLGYCINSVLSQTYTNLEVILVNDGSTDASLKICRNYAAIDERVKVIDTSNGGVSRARNLGIESATGEYLQFVDSDDCIAQNMIEKMVTAMETYQLDLAICSFKIITLKDNIPANIQVCTSKGLGEECVLPRDLFLKRMPSILWKTALLESACNKILKTKLVKDFNIRFEENLSLGEDFSMYIKYFSVCNGTVLLSDELYYYMQVNDSALTKVYRKDLFENQMMLIDRFREFWEANSEISEEEEVSLAEYTVSKTLQCMTNLFHRGAAFSVEEKKRLLAAMINDNRVRIAIEKSKYIDTRFQWIRELYKFSDVEMIYRNLNSIFASKECLDNGQHCTEKIEEQPKNPGALNKFLVKGINLLLNIHQFRALEMIRNTLIDHGIKTTIIKSLTYYKKRRC